MPKIIEKIFAQRHLLEQDLLTSTQIRLTASIQKKGYASMLLSGSKSPLNFYRLLANTKLPWNNIYLSLTDERWVPTFHDDSNEKNIRLSLLNNYARTAAFTGLKTLHEDIAEGFHVTEENLQNLPKPYTQVLLGMGEDGHIASLFPGSADAQTALNPDCKTQCTPIRDLNNTCPRISMTLSALLCSEHIVLLFFGKQKWDVYQIARQNELCKLPVQHILQQNNVPVTVYWTV